MIASRDDQFRCFIADDCQQSRGMLRMIIPRDEMNAVATKQSRAIGGGIGADDVHEFTPRFKSIKNVLPNGTPHARYE